MPTPTRPMMAWLEVLDQIDRTLEHALALLDSAPPHPAAPVPPPPEPLQPLEERLARWQAAVEGAAARARALDERLEADAAAVRGWLADLAAVRQTLAAGGGSAVG
jgi:hypothetical protein